MENIGNLIFWEFVFMSCCCWREGKKKREYYLSIFCMMKCMVFLDNNKNFILFCSFHVTNIQFIWLNQKSSFQRLCIFFKRIFQRLEWNPLKSSFLHGKNKRKDLHWKIIYSFLLLKTPFFLKHIYQKTSVWYSKSKKNRGLNLWNY